MGLILWLLVGIIAGWLTGVILKGRGYGLIGDLVLGLVGGWLGGALLGTYVGSWGLIGAILVATFGAVVLVAIVRLLRRV